MKEWIRWILCLGLLIASVQAASAFTVKEINVPKTDLKANDNVNLELEMSVSGFSSSHDFQISGDLTGTSCVVSSYNEEITQYENVLVDQDRAGNWILLGWVLPTHSSFVLKITYSGKVPATSSRNVTLVRISELSAGAVVGTPYVLERQMVNPQEVTSQITSVRSDLQALKQTITTKAGQGVDTSEASAKANEADSALAKADSLKSSSFSQALTQIDLARTAITNGYTLIDKAEAQQEIDQVEETMSEVESMVTYFTVNRSISQTDSRLIAITTKYDLASQSISTANDLVAAGNYLNGRAKAAEASKYANDAYNLSEVLKKEIGEGGISLPGINPLFLVIGIGVIAIGVVGYFAYRKFFHWDELG
jgi:hypothetical protein